MAAPLLHRAPGAIAEPGPFTLWYAQPASKWEEALPVGNGRLGAMIFGGVEKERLQLNEITVWSGKLETEADRPDAFKSLPSIRGMIRDGRYSDATRAMNAERTCLKGGKAGVGTYGSYQTLGDLDFEFETPGGPVTDYRRWLDIENAVAGVSYRAGEDVLIREILSSAPDQVLVMRVACSRKSRVDFNVRLSRLKWAETRQSGPGALTMTGTSTGEPGDLRYEVQLRLLPKGGTVQADADKLFVKGADEVTVLVTAGTDYVLDYAKAYKGSDPHDSVSAAMKRAARPSFADIKREHVNDYRSYFRRVSLDLGRSANAALATDERLRKFSAGEEDPGLIALFYQYGR